MKGVLLETDVIVEYLTAAPDEVPLMRRLLGTISCCTTFLQAAEIYSAARDDGERRTVEQALFGLKILGASSRYAKTIALLLSSEGRMGGHRTAIVAAMAIESGLPVITDDHLQEFGGISGLRLIEASTLRRTPDHAALADALATIEPAG